MSSRDSADSAIARQVEALAHALLARRETVATAESCTGGWLSKCLTDRPGSSAWFGFGFITYANGAKERQLDVPAELLARYGAVSGEVADAMARGALRASGASWAVAVTGIAGPDGGSADKPVGTVWIAVAGSARGGASASRRHRFPGDRTAVRRAAVAAALEAVLAALGAPPAVG
jgi:nicotinamide-nucleotide amidase